MRECGEGALGALDAYIYGREFGADVTSGCTPDLQDRSTGDGIRAVASVPDERLSGQQPSSYSSEGYPDIYHCGLGLNQNHGWDPRAKLIQG